MREAGQLKRQLEEAEGRREAEAAAARRHLAELQAQFDRLAAMTSREQEARGEPRFSS